MGGQAMSNNGQELLSDHGIETSAVHAGWAPDASTGAVNPPIYATSTFAQDKVGGLRGGYEYSRTGNPTRTALEQALAELERGKYGRAFSSGMAATDSVLRALLKPGDHIIIPNDVYGGTFRLIDKVFAQWGIDYTPAPISDLEAVKAAVTSSTKLVWVETPTNPLLTIADIPGVAEIAHSVGARLVVDNTFATPALQQPLVLGADIVVHSTTKYIGGHSDVVGGAVVTADETIDEAVAFMQNSAGAIAGPFDSFLTLRGLRSLPVRMERHSANALAIATRLVEHPAVKDVIYPGLESHPGHAVATRHMRGFGGMVSIRLNDREAAQRLCGRVRIFTLAESLGGVESLIEHPSAMTHASTAGSVLEVPSDLVRLSVGLESAQDLIADLVEALD